MRVTTWMWCGPLAFVVHDAEEVATVAGWLADNRGRLPHVVQPLAGITTTQFAIGVAVLLVGYILATVHGVHRARAGRMSLPWLAVTGAFVANGVTHVAQAAWIGGYVPGLVTAVVVSLPYGIGAARAYRGAGLASWPAIGAAGALGLGLQVPLALAALAAGGAL